MTTFQITCIVLSASGGIPYIMTLFKQWLVIKSHEDADKLAGTPKAFLLHNFCVFLTIITMVTYSIFELNFLIIIGLVFLNISSLISFAAYSGNDFKLFNK